MKALLNDLRLRDRRELLKDILENAVPVTLQDVVIVFVTVSGMRGGQLVQETYANKIYAAPWAAACAARFKSPPQAAFAPCSTCCAGHLPQSGLIKQEEIALEPFLANRFGRCYAIPPVAASNAA